MYKNLLFIPFVLFLTSTFGQINQEIQNALTSVDPAEVKATMAFLSDDLLEGRQPGTKGFALASHYIQTEFMSIGLKPGVGDSFIQRVPLVKGIVNSDESKFVLEGGSTAEEVGLFGSEFFVSNLPVSKKSIAFNINTDGMGYNDKTVVTVLGLTNVKMKSKIIGRCKLFNLQAIEPEALSTLYEASDNYSFAKVGIPAITFSPGILRKDQEIYLYYHTPQDEMKTLDFVYLKKFYGSFVSVIEVIANGDSNE